MMTMKPHFDRDAVLRMEAWHRALAACTESIPALLHEHETVGPPVREGDRIVLRITRKDDAAAGA